MVPLLCPGQHKRSTTRDHVDINISFSADLQQINLVGPSCAEVTINSNQYCCFEDVFSATSDREKVYHHCACELRGIY